MRAYPDVLNWWLSLLISALLLTGCGGGGTSSTSISGTVATGAALTGTVEVVDANGVTKSANIGAGGAFTIDTTGLYAPIMLRATGSGGSAGTILYSLADGVTGVFNITPLTHLALELLRQEGATGTQTDLAALFAAWNAEIDPTDRDALHTAMLNAQAAINANLAAQFQAHGLTPTSYDFLRTAFTPDLSGLDAVLEAISSLSISGNQIDLVVSGNPIMFNVHIDISGYSIGAGSSGGGGSGGSGGSGGGSLSCDTTLFQPNSVHAATSQELADFAGSYTGDIYTNDGQNNYVQSSGTAAFTANGGLTLNGQAKTPTSICVDNQAGSFGVVLYVHFADGHVDLFANDTFSGSIDTPSGGGSGGGSGGNNHYLTLAVTVSGIAGANVQIDGVSAPANQTAFCSDMTDTNSSTSLSSALGVVGTFTINSCSFNGSVGTVSATLAITSPVALNVPYSVVYTYH